MLTQMSVMMALTVAQVSMAEPLLPHHCLQTNSSLTCDYSIPYRLPHNISEVNIRSYASSNISKEAFIDDSWHNVITLDIKKSGGFPLLITSNTFQNLVRLERLGMHCYKVYFERHSFAGLSFLRSLDMSNSGKLEQNSFFQSLIDDKHTLKRLTSLNLNFVNSRNAAVIVLDFLFYEAMCNLPVKSLYTHGANLVLSNGVPQICDSSLNYLDASNTTFIKIVEFHLIRGYIFNLLKQLRVVNISHVIFPAYSGTLSFVDTVSSSCAYTSLNHVVADNVVPGHTHIVMDNVIFNYTNCGEEFYVEHLQLRQNNILKLNLTLVLPESNRIRYVDLAANGLKYISPYLFWYAQALEVVILSANELFKMQDTPEFERLLGRQPKLTYLDMSNNGLSHVPARMFENNTLMKRLDLSGNLLKTIEFNLYNLSRLDTLQLQSNRIIFLDKGVISRINAALARLQQRNITTNINLHDNPLECSCKGLWFLQWLVNELNVQDVYTCKLEGNVVPINQATIEQAGNLCTTSILPAEFWFLLSVYISAVVTVFALLFKYLWSRYLTSKLQGERQKFIQNYTKRHVRENCLIFLSENFDSADVADELLFCDVLNNMKRELRELFGDGWRDDMIKSDNVYIIPGMIRDEVVNTIIAKCCAVVIIQSVSDPENRHFKTDLELAKEHGKPVCILSPCVGILNRNAGRYFGRLPSFDLHDKDGAWVPEEGWAEVCKTVLNMAAASELQ